MNDAAVATRRLFVALWPSAELRAAIARAVENAVRSHEVRRIPPDNFHITLVFLGAVPDSRLADVRGALRETKFTAGDLILDRISWWERQELLCLEPGSGSQELRESVERLHAALRSRGFSLETRAFRPHVTLARDVRREPEVMAIEALKWQSERFELVESRLSAHGSRYTILDR